MSLFEIIDLNAEGDDYIPQGNKVSTRVQANHSKIGKFKNTCAIAALYGHINVTTHIKVGRYL